MRTLHVVAFLVLASFLGSCRSMYYSTMEQFGVHKRDILVDRVEEARDAQTEAKEEFKSALEAFQAVTGFQGKELGKAYERLNDKYESSSEKAAEVKERIDSIEKVAGDLFEEWDEEIAQMQNADYRSRSKKLLADTRDRSEELVTAMRKAEAKMKPVLAAFKDHVLFLKHNLNAQAIASLKGELDTIEDSVAALVFDMEKSIKEANEFIEQMDSAKE